MNKVILIITVLVIVYLLFRAFMKVTKLLLKIAIVFGILLILGYGVINVADLIPNQRAAEKVSHLIDKIPEDKIPGNQLISDLVPEKEEVEVIPLNETENLSLENLTEEDNVTTEQNLTELT